MPLRLYADECVDRRVVAGLLRRGVDVVTAAEQGLLGATDEAHVVRARALQRVIVSEDHDFLRIFGAPVESRLPLPGLIFILPAAPVGAVIGAISVLAAVLDPAELEGWIEWVP